jgi:hypothetical protein
MKRSLFCILFFLAIVGTVSARAHTQDNHVEWPSKKVQTALNIVHQIQQLTARSLESKYHVRCIGHGAGMCGGPIREVSLSFQVLGPLTKNEVRWLLFDMKEEMIAQARRIPNIDCYLAEPPFDHRKVNIVLFQIDAQGRELRYPIYDACSFDGDSISYDATDSIGGPWVPYKESLTETYEEAVEALRKEYQEFQTAELLDRAPG